ncbi:hypothetical protein EOM09_03825 [bacterium]|nr:hypothetical protein [bacterium]
MNILINLAFRFITFRGIVKTFIFLFLLSNLMMVFLYVSSIVFVIIPSLNDLDTGLLEYIFDNEFTLGQEAEFKRIAEIRTDNIIRKIFN